MKKMLTLALTVLALASNAAEMQIYDIPLVLNNKVFSNGTMVATGYGAFSNTVSAYVDLDSYKPQGFFSVHAIMTGGAGTISNISSSVSVFGPTKENPTTEYKWNTNAYSPIVSAAATTNVLTQVFTVPTRFIKFDFVPTAANTNQLSARLIIH